MTRGGLPPLVTHALLSAHPNAGGCLRLDLRRPRVCGRVSDDKITCRLLTGCQLGLRTSVDCILPAMQLD